MRFLHPYYSLLLVFMPSHLILKRLFLRLNPTSSLRSTMKHCHFISEFTGLILTMTTSIIKSGVCLLNDPYQKDRSIRYLKQASKNINPKYKENNFRERTAPPEAFFHLGNAYLVNDSIDKAKENYLHFRDILDEKVYDVELVEEQIRICDRGSYLKTMPVDYDYHNLGESINTRFADINPIVSGNGDRLIYVSKMQFYDATFFSEKIDGEWQPPRNIIPELGVDGDVYPTSLSWDGNTMIIYRNDDFVGNLYVSSYENGRWTALKKLGNNINTKYWESHGSLSKDGKTLYFHKQQKRWIWRTGHIQI